jgi:hypothetical protein
MSVGDALRACALLVVVLGAGCAGLGAPVAPGGPATDSAAGPGTTATAPAAAETVTSTPAPPRNPWRADPITVAVSVDADTERAFAGPVNESLAYWNANIDRTPYEGRFRLVADAGSADVVVRFVEEVTDCGTESGAALVGCAPRYDAVGQATRYGETTVQVDADLNETTLVRTLNHELGHTLGLDHGDADRFPFMTARGPATTVPRPDFRNRSYFWAADNTALSVHVDLSGVPEALREDRRADVAAVLGTYERSERLPDGVAFERTDNRTDAEIVIEFAADGPTDRQVDVRRYGRDTDADGRLEYLVRAEFTVAVDGGDPERYLGYYMAFALFADEPEDVPEAYRP